MRVCPRSLLALAVIVVVIALHPAAFAQSIVIADYEHAAREIQARHVAVRAAYRSYPDTSGTAGAGPRYPDGYYTSLSNRTTRTLLVLEIKNGFEALLDNSSNRNWFVRPTDISDTMSGIPAPPPRSELGAIYSDDPAQWPTTNGAEDDPTNIGRCNAIINGINAAILHLTHNKLSGPSLNSSAWVHMWGGASGAASPEQARDLALSTAPNSGPPGVCSNETTTAWLAYEAVSTGTTSGYNWEIQYPRLAIGASQNSSPYIGDQQVWIRIIQTAQSCTHFSMSVPYDGPSAWLPGDPTSASYHRILSGVAVTGSQAGTLASFSDRNALTSLSHGSSAKYMSRVSDTISIGSSSFPFIEDWTNEPAVSGPTLASVSPLGVRNWGDYADDPCLEKNRTAAPIIPNPVSAASGTKAERAVDLSVTIDGDDYSLIREYNSDPSYLSDAGGSAVGRGWMLTATKFLRMRKLTNSQMTNSQIELVLEGYPASSYLVFDQSQTGSPISTTTWSSRGPSTQTIIQTSLQVNGDGFKAQNTFRLRDPGGWSYDFERPTFPSSGEVVCRIVREQDAYGHTRSYVYEGSGAANPTNRVRAVLLNGTPGAKDGSPPNQTIYPGTKASAEVLFNWRTTGPLAGRLGSVQVRRFDDVLRSYVTTDKVEYKYLGDGTVGTGAWSVDIGDNSSQLDDLIQVISWKQVGACAVGQQSTTMLPRVTQYRYHRGTASNSSSTDERLTVTGASHQLKLVIAPEQIEYFARKYLASTQLPGTPAAQDYVPLAAATLLNQADGDTVFTDSSGSYKVVDLASKVVGYEATGGRRVSSQFVQAGCACGGGTSGFKNTYSYLGTSTYPSTRIDEWHYVSSSGGYTSLYRTSFEDMELRVPTSNSNDNQTPVPLLKYRVTRDPADNRSWVEEFTHNSAGDLVKRSTPALYGSYTPATSSAAASVGSDRSTGLIHGFDYDSNHRIIRHKLYFGLADATGVVVDETDYRTDSRSDLVSQIRRFTQQGSTAANTVETTTLQYGFYDVEGATAVHPKRVSFVRTIRERELESENGPSGTNQVVSYECFDASGRNTWSVLPDGSLTHRKFDPGTGELIELVRNANATGTTGTDGLVQDRFDAGEFVSVTDGDAPRSTTSASFGRWADGGELRTKWTLDRLGRTTSTQVPGGDVSGAPSGVTNYTVCQIAPLPDAPSGQQSVYFLQETALPYQLSDGTFSGPAVASWSTAGGRTVQARSYELSSSGYNPPALAFTFGTELSRSVSTLTVSGMVDHEDRWWDIATDAKYTTSYTYDGAGRIERTTSATGTVKRVAYDVLDRVVEEYCGNGTSEQLVATYGYDTTTGGIGNGNLTLVRQYTGESSGTEVRETVRSFDARDRLIKAVLPTPPHKYIDYDNLDRPIREAWFTAEPTAIDTPLASRGRYVEYSYGQRGLVYRTAEATNPSSSSVTFLESHSWRDDAGRVIAQWGPSGPAVKRRYDGLGRVTTEYVSCRDGDSNPGATGNYADAASMSDDTVVEETSTTYADSSSRWTGLPVLIKTLHRVHSSASVGDLDTTGASPSGVATFKAFYYDGANRVIRSVDFGTNTAATTGVAPTGIFESGGAAPSWPPSSAPDPSATDQSQLVFATKYDSRGLTHTTTSPLGTKTQYFYDDLGRTIAIAENASGSLARSSVTFSGGRWNVPATGTQWLTTNPAENRTTSRVYDGGDHVTKDVAHQRVSNADSPEITQYRYVWSSSTDGDSLIASNDTLYDITYPSHTTPVHFAYNRQGEMRLRRDERGVVRTFTRDLAGRVVTDAAVTIPTLTPPIDSTIDKISRAYDGMGRLKEVDSINGSTVKNAVGFRYSELGQVTGVYQDYDGPLVLASTDGEPASTDNTQLLAHTYETHPYGQSGYHNYSRLVTTTYPDGSVVTHSYGTATNTEAIDIYLSRVDAMQLGSTTTPFVQYGFVGLGMTAYVDYPWSDVQLDRTLAPPGFAAGTRHLPTHTTSGAPVGKYPGYDRFGRVRTSAWVDGQLGLNNSSTAVPNVPPIVHDRYEYDNGSVIIDKLDVRPGVRQSVKEERFTNDGLSRLTKVDRGVQGSSWTPGPGGQEWDLDALGNWPGHRVDIDGATGFEIVEARNANLANEVTSRTVNGASANLAYDATGNTQTVGEVSTPGSYTQNRLFRYDAWNRIVRVDGQGTMPNMSWQTWYGVYGYNGLGWRITATNGLAIPMQTRMLYYDENWRLIEEHINSDPMDDVHSPTNWVEQEFWGVRAADDPVLRRIRKPTTPVEGSAPNRWNFSSTVDTPYYHITDHQFSTVAMVFATGAKPLVFERLSYDAYGTATRRLGADLDCNGVVNDADAALSQNADHTDDINNPNYDVAVDFNRDGVSNEYDGDEALNWKYIDQSSNGISSTAATVYLYGPGPSNVFGYCGYVYSGYAGIYVVRNRGYAPILGRWLQRDPIGALDSANLFDYCSDSPVSFVDSLGLAAEGSPAGPTKTKTQWRFVARQNAGITESTWETLADPKRTQTRVQIQELNKIYNDYSRLGAAGPGLIWAKAAANAKMTILSQVALLDDLDNSIYEVGRHAMWEEGPLVGLPQYIGAGWASSQAGKVHGAMVQIAQNIFDDMAWQHEAYLAGGLRELRALVDAGELDRRVFFDGWCKLAHGNYRAGAINLAYYEQRYLAQPRWNELSSSLTFSFEETGISWLAPKTEVPGSLSFWEYQYKNGVTSPNILNLSQRFNWLSKDVMPAYFDVTGVPK